MTIQSFKSVDEMFAAIEKAQVIADANVQGWQKTLDPGSYFIREALGIQIFCEVLPWPEDEEDEPGNYRFCKCYSEMCPEGELGDVHISTAVRRITGEEFRAAKLAGWQ